MIREVAFLFLKLGCIAFGGPAAHIGMMENEVVTRRRWMSRQHFLDLVGATNLIPGPNSTQMVMHCGLHRAGYPGLVVGGMCFIIPAALLTGILASLYVKYGKIPAFEPFLYGIKPAVIIIILNAVYRLGKKAVKGYLLAFIGVGVLIISMLGVSEIVSILAGGFTGMLLIYSKNRFSGIKTACFSPLLFKMNVYLPFGALPPAVSGALDPISLLKLFLLFFKIGAVLFGSGYVLVAYLDGELVQSLGWLTANELVDAIAVGQLTPGPILSTSTFIGYYLHGISGAAVATAGMFLPSFFFVAVLNPLIPGLRKSKLAAGFLDAVNISAVSIMITATVHLSKEVLIDWKSWLIALASAVLVFKFKKINSAYLVLGSALLGFFLYRFF